MGKNNCPAGMYPRERICHTCDKSCTLCNTSSICETCALGYLPGREGLCIQCPPNSNYKAATLTCECLNGLFFSRGACVA